MNRLLYLVVVGPLAVVSACGGRLSGTDSTTQFWLGCAADAECGGLSCICGRCTEVCTLDGECSRYGVGANCAEQDANECGAPAAPQQATCRPSDALTGASADDPVDPAGPTGSKDSTPLSVSNGASGATGEGDASSGPIGPSGAATPAGPSGPTGSIGPSGPTGASDDFGGTAIGCGIQQTTGLPTFDLGETQGWSSVANAIGDLDNDGNQDLALVNSDASSVAVLIGNGDGTFANKITYDTDEGPNSIAVFDLNDDRISDVVTANGTAGTVSVFLGRDGALAPRVDYPAGEAPWDLAVGDLDGDGYQDVVVLHATSTGGFSILAGIGDGTLAAPAQHLADASGQNRSWSAMEIGDLDANGILDVIVADEHVRALLGSDSGEFAVVEYEEAEFYSATDIAVGDFDGDRSVDLGVADQGGRGPVPALNVMPGLGDGGFSNSDAYQALSGSSFDDIVVGQLNHDERSDIVGCGPTVGFFMADDQGKLVQTCQTTLSCEAVAIGDLNNDSEVDVALVGVRANGYGASVLLGNGDGTFVLGAGDAPTGR